MSALPPTDASRLVKFLGMLGSEHAGERASAGQKAHELVTSRNLTWADVLPSASARPPKRSARTRTEACRPDPVNILKPHQRLAMAIGNCGFAWTDWERGFLTSMQRWRGQLSERQASQLSELEHIACAWRATRGPSA